MTSWSLNCSRMSSHRGVGGSSGMAVSGNQWPLAIVRKGGSKRTVPAMLQPRGLDLAV